VVIVRRRSADATGTALSVTRALLCETFVGRLPAVAAVSGRRRCRALAAAVADVCRPT
jgi:hypothetical protein